MIVLEGARFGNMRPIDVVEDVGSLVLKQMMVFLFKKKQAECFHSVSVLD